MVTKVQVIILLHLRHQGTQLSPRCVYQRFHQESNVEYPTKCAQSFDHLCIICTLDDKISSTSYGFFLPSRTEVPAKRDMFDQKKKTTTKNKSA